MGPSYASPPLRVSCRNCVEALSTPAFDIVQRAYAVAAHLSWCRCRYRESVTATAHHPPAWPARLRQRSQRARASSRLPGSRAALNLSSMSSCSLLLLQSPQYTQARWRSHARMHTTFAGRQGTASCGRRTLGHRNILRLLHRHANHQAAVHGHLSLHDGHSARACGFWEGASRAHAK